MSNTFIAGDPNSIIYGYGSIGSTGIYNYINPINLTVFYSMRNVISTYTGPVVNVRRSTDNATSDFYTDLTQSYFTTGSNGTGTTYDTWITGATGYIRIWYDQSGTNNNATNSVNGTTQPLVAKITAPNSKSYYVVKWLSGSGTKLTMTTPMNPKTIFCHFWNDNGTIATIISGVFGADDNFRFVGGTSFATGDGNDWYYSGTGTKIAYVNGVSSTTVTLSSVGGPTTAGWNVMGTSVSSPVTFNFQLVGQDGYNISRNIDGYMVEIFAHNTTIDSTNMVQYYNDRLF